MIILRKRYRFSVELSCTTQLNVVYYENEHVMYANSSLPIIFEFKSYMNFSPKEILNPFYPI